ncbi:YidB family protein [soil metagenome]
MARGMPSMVALLGLLAVAGYQNRDKLAEMLGGAGNKTPGDPNNRDSGGILGNLGGLLGGTGIGNVLSGGLGDLVDQFKQNGQGSVADSWVKTGPNQTIEPQQVEKALGSDVLDTLAKQTGLSKDELLARLAKALPEAVDKYTPDGRVPTPDEAARPA